MVMMMMMLRMMRMMMRIVRLRRMMMMMMAVVDNGCGCGRGRGRRGRGGCCCFCCCCCWWWCCCWWCWRYLRAIITAITTLNTMHHDIIFSIGSNEIIWQTLISYCISFCILCLMGKTMVSQCFLSIFSVKLLRWTAAAAPSTRTRAPARA